MPITSAFTLAVGLSAAQLPQPTGSGSVLPQPLFESQEVLQIWTAFDRETVTEDIGRHLGDNEYEGQRQHPATLSYLAADGDTVRLQVTVETRGHFRRDPDNCNFPPLRFDLDKSDIDDAPRQNSIFANQNRLKLVAHCQNGRDEYEQFTLQEYLVYRTYNLLSDLSFRVRLARITYIDTAEREDPLTKYGFFIEDNDLVAARFGGEILEMEGLHPLDLEYTSMTVLSLFQYMMRNTDWSVQGLHNIELVGPIQGLVYPLPYDFDWAGIVAPPYAEPDPSLRIRSVRDLHYMGYCRTEDELEQAFSVFNRNQEAIYELHRNLAGLDQQKLRRMLEDYNRFFHIINRPNEVARTIMRQCRER